MKKLSGTIISIFITTLLFAQQKLIDIKIVDATTKTALENATVIVNNQTFITNNKGIVTYNNKNAKTLSVKISLLGYNEDQKDFNISETANIVIELKKLTYDLVPLEVKSIRASDKSPFTKTNLSKKEIEKNNNGQDLPFILNQTPSVVANSDAGNGIGYTGIRIRGTDATRINVTLNGIPYNDAESQGTFFVNLPDFASSANSIQIQRGVGTSTNGTGAFGATINISTNEINEKAYAELNNSVGSFNSFKNTIKVGTGLMNNHFTLDARLSNITSDGFVNRASSNLQAAYVSAAYINTNSSLRLNIFTGKEKTYQAWYGIPEDFLKDNRQYNFAGTEKPGEPYNNETDNYNQTHYQLFYNLKINNWQYNITSFFTRGKGYYENYRANQKFSRYGLPNPVINNITLTQTDLVRQLWLDNYFYGQQYTAENKGNKHLLTFGVGWNKYYGKHYGKIPWAQFGIPKDYEFYNLDARKNDIHLYTKLQYDINNNLSWFGDIQYRYVEHTMNGFRNNPTLFVSRNFNFINPKTGITYIKNGWQTYFSYAVAGKEPNRDDFEAGLTVQPKAEILHNFEFGTEKKTKQYSLSANLYYMLYNNQLVLTGKINDVGAYTRTNVPHSYRLGLELQAAYIFNNQLNAGFNATLSTNKIKSFTEYIDDYDNGGQIAIEHTNTDIALSPNVMSNIFLNYLPIKNIELSLIGKYVGKQFLDNTQNANRILQAFYNQDVRVSYTFNNKLLKNANLFVQVFNVFNSRYEPNGYTFSYLTGGSVITENYYFPMAGTNFMAGFNIKL